MSLWPLRILNGPGAVSGRFNPSPLTREVPINSTDPRAAIVAAIVEATGLDPAAAEDALARAGDAALDPWGAPPLGHPDVAALRVAAEINPDDCGCCGSVTVWVVGPRGRFAAESVSGAL